MSGRGTARARTRGVPVEGICLYPVANHLGWDDDRLCQNGLLGHLPVSGRTARSADPQLLAAIRATPLPGAATPSRDEDRKEQTA